MKKGKKLSKHIISIIALSYVMLALVVEITVFVVSVIMRRQDGAILVVLFTLPITAVVVGVGMIYISHMSDVAMDKMTTAITRITNGDFAYRIELDESDGFGEVYENFNKMAAELSSVKTLREDYVSNFSHEIKTPLAAISGFARLLAEGTLTEEESKETLGIIVKESERLSRLSHNILILSKVENQKVVGECKEYRLDLQITDCVIMLERQWSEKNITINTDMQSVTYRGDEQLLQQVWVNLLINAIKYTPEGGEITVKLSLRNGKTVAKVIDNGIGMTEEQTTHAFDKYYQAKPTKISAGSGLGLAICKRICELVGGDIAVKSKLGEGSTFTVTL